MNFEVYLKSTTSWSSGGNGSITVRNVGPNEVQNWSFDIITNGYQIKDMWNATYSSGIISGKDWNKNIKAGGEIQSDFSYSGTFNSNALSNNSGVKIVNLDIIDDVPDVVPVDPTTGSGTTSNKVIFGYFSEWSIYGREFSVEKIPNNLTHIVYAFLLPNPSSEDVKKLNNPPVPYDPNIPEGTLVYHDYYAAKQNIEKLKTLKAKDPNKKVVISVGGWTLSLAFSKIAADPVLRKRFVDSCVKYVVEHGFDGIDFDWEFVGKQGIGYNHVDEVNDGPNFVQLLKETREALDLASPNKHLEITAATGCNPQVLANYTGTEPYMDYLLLMSYDFAGGWDTYGGHLSAIYHNPNSRSSDQNNCHAAVKNAMKAGYPSNKICLGVPFYGRGWQKLEGNTIFGKSLNGAATSVSPVGVGESGMSRWRDIRDNINNGTYTAYEDDIAKTAYCIDANGKTWSYDSPQTVKYKAQYVVDNNLAGVLIWELSDDTNDGKDNLLDAMNEVFDIAQPDDVVVPDDSVPDIHPVKPPQITKVIWENKWNNPGTYRKIIGVRNTDPHDDLTNFRGGGYFSIENGEMTLSGGQPRFYVDVTVSGAEASFEYQRIGTDGYNWSGCVCGIRSNSEGHVDQGDAHTYYFRLRHDNKIDFYRELTHGVTGVILNSKPYELKPNTWYKYKFQCYNENGFNKLKGYINDKLVLEAEDDNKHMYNSVGKVFIRNTNIEKSIYRNFVIKEINQDGTPIAVPDDPVVVDPVPDPDPIVDDPVPDPVIIVDPVPDPIPMVSIKNEGDTDIVIKPGQTISVKLV